MNASKEKVEQNSFIDPLSIGHQRSVVETVAQMTTSATIIRSSEVYPAM
jgi:hypothetical protein